MIWIHTQDERQEEKKSTLFFCTWCCLNKIIINKRNDFFLLLHLIIRDPSSRRCPLSQLSLVYSRSKRDTLRCTLQDVVSVALSLCPRGPLQYHYLSNATHNQPGAIINHRINNRATKTEKARSKKYIYLRRVLIGFTWCRSSILIRPNLTQPDDERGRFSTQQRGDNNSIQQRDVLGASCWASVSCFAVHCRCCFIPIVLLRGESIPELSAATIFSSSSSVSFGT